MSYVCNINIGGIIVPILTPVDENEEICEKTLRKQVNFVIDGGVSGILAYGSNGEFYMFDYEDIKKGLEIIIDETNNRVPVFCGIGEIRTSKCIEIAKMAENLGADGISVIQPMFLNPTEDELYYHFKTIAESVPNLSMLLYNNPGRTGYTLSSNLVSKLARNIPNIIGMKDSSGDITQLSEFIRVTKDVEFSVLGGKDTLIYPTLAMGGCGSVCTTANVFPELVCSIYELYMNERYNEALEKQYILNPVRLSMDKASFPVATKDMAHLVGHDVGEPIKPSLRSCEDCLSNMKHKMQEANLI